MIEKQWLVDIQKRAEEAAVERSSGLMGRDCFDSSADVPKLLEVVEQQNRQLAKAESDSIVRCCQTCNATTKGTYNGRCLCCSLCEVVPEMFRKVHKTRYTKSLWEWDSSTYNI